MSKQFRLDLDRIKEYYSIKMILLSLLVGVVCGLFATVFNYSVHLVYTAFIEIPFSHLNSSEFSYLRWIPLLLSPALGGLLVGVLLSRFSKETKGHGVPNVISAYHMNRAIIDKNIPLSKLVASTLTLGSGGCAGKEGPAIQIGAGIGSYFAQKFNMSETHRQILLICGLSACMGATFNAPIGATLFAIEVIRPKISLKCYPLILLSTVTAMFFNYFVMGDNVLLEGTFTLNFINWEFVGLSILLGCLSGLLSVAWIYLFYGVEIQIHKGFKLLRVPQKIQPAFGGLVIGIFLCITFLFFGDSWTSYSISGHNMYPMNEILNGNIITGEFWFVLRSLIFVSVLKTVGTSFTLGSGGSGGLFAPTLFIGIFFGAIFGVITKALFNLTLEYQIAFALIGMAAFLAGTYRAPLTAIVITAEISDGFQFIVPLMLASAMGYLFSFLISAEDMNEMDFKLQGISLKHFSPQALDRYTVGEFMYPLTFFKTAQSDMQVSKAIERVKRNTITALPILENDKFINLVILRDLVKLVESDVNTDSMTLKETIAQFGLREPVTVNKDTPLLDVVTLMAFNDISNVPVVEKVPDGSMKLVGWFDSEMLKKLKEEGLDTKDDIQNVKD